MAFRCLKHSKQYDKIQIILLSQVNTAYLRKNEISSQAFNNNNDDDNINNNDSNCCVLYNCIVIKFNKLINDKEEY